MSDSRVTTSSDGNRVRSQWDHLIAANWLWVLGVGSAVLVGLSTALRFAADPYWVSIDSALFQHAGWYIANGATPYVDFWDIKPPLIYAVTTLLAVLSGGNMAVLHLLSVGLAVALIVAGTVLVGLLTYRLTGDSQASLAAGTTVFVLPSTYTFPVAGIRPKYFAFAFGVGALLLAVEDRPAASGVAAAVAAGFWQLGGLLALIVVGIGLQRGGLRAFGRTVGGGVLVLVAVVAPFVAAGLTIPLFLETVLAPILTVERYTVGGRLLEFLLVVGYGVVLLPIGIYGWVRGVLDDPSRYWWVGVGGALYLLQVFLELQGTIELILLWPFVAIGVGVVIAALPTPSRASVVVGVIALLAVLNVWWFYSPVTPVKDGIETAHQERAIADYETVAPPPRDVPSMETIYWDQREPVSCHYRAGYKQRHFVTKVDTTVDKRTCGQWPFEKSPRAWLLDALIPFE